MIEKIYIQHNEDDYPITESSYAAMDGFNAFGIEILKFQKSVELEDVGLTKSTAVHGYIGPVLRAFKILGAPKPELEDYPEVLTKYLGRKVWEATMGDVRDVDEPIFIKPKEQKLFTGHIRHLNTSFFHLTKTAFVPDDAPVFCSELVYFDSEYRVFVLENKIVGSKQYNGTYRKLPDYDIVDAAINDYAPTAPAAYSIDFGITNDDRTLMIEVNDAYSLGSYGLPSISYAKMIEARWVEIVGEDEV